LRKKLETIKGMTITMVATAMMMGMNVSMNSSIFPSGGEG
jgi:hypothetical protein